MINPMWSRTEYGEVVHLTGGNPTVPEFLLPEIQRNQSEEEIPKRTEGQRVADSPVVFMKSGPMKAGNRPEDKTLMTGARLPDNRPALAGWEKW